MFAGNKFYGIKRAITQYCRLSEATGIPMAIIHGALFAEDLLYTRGPLTIWTFSEREVPWFANHRWGAMALGAPILYYLANRGIRPFQPAGKRGNRILVLPSHSTHQSCAVQNHAAIADAVVDLVGKQDLGRVTIHLYGLDLPVAPVYLRRGLSVASSGTQLDRDFYDRFIEHVLGSGMVLSNGATTGLAYGAAFGLEVERLSIPCAIVGKAWFEHSDAQALGKEEEDAYWQGVLGPQRMDYAASMLGAAHVRSPEALAQILAEHDTCLRRTPARRGLARLRSAAHDVVERPLHWLLEAQHRRRLVQHRRELARDD